MVTKEPLYNYVQHNDSMIRTIGRSYDFKYAEDRLAVSLEHYRFFHNIGMDDVAENSLIPGYGAIVRMLSHTSYLAHRKQFNTMISQIWWKLMRAQSLGLKLRAVKLLLVALKSVFVHG